MLRDGKLVFYEIYKYKVYIIYVGISFFAEKNSTADFIT